MVKDSHCEGKLCKFLVAHYDIGGESSVFGRTHSREVYAVFCSPVLLAKVAQVVCHHCDIGVPLFKSDENSHTDRVNAGHTHSVKTVDSPFEVGFHTLGVVDLVIFPVVCLLETDHSVKSMGNQFGILFSLERHYLNLEIGEIPLGDVKSLGKIGDTCLDWVFSCHHQQVLERAKFFDSLELIFHLLGGQDGPGHGIADMESAVNT